MGRLRSREPRRIGKIRGMKTRSSSAASSSTEAVEPDDGIDRVAEDLRRAKRRSALRTLALVMAGGALGLVYHFTIGCSTGACALTATPERSMLYGMLVGVVVAML